MKVTISNDGESISLFFQQQTRKNVEKKTI